MVALWSAALAVISVPHSLGETCIDYRDYIHEVGRIDFSSTVRGVAVAGDRAYVVGGSALRIINIAVPSSPTVMSQVTVSEGTGAQDVAIMGSHAYVAGGPRGLRIVDVSNSSAPVVVGTIDTPGPANDVAVAGNYCYLADGDLKVIDISNAQSPQIVGSVVPPNALLGVAVSGSYVYLACSVAGVRVVDVSNPAMPTLVGAAAVGEASDVAIAGNFLYVATGLGLTVLSLTNPVSPSFVGAEGTGISERIAVAGNTVILADFNPKIHAVDISDPFQPRRVATFEMQRWPSGMAMAGEYAYVGIDGNSFRILDVSNPHAPEPVGVWEDFGADRAAVVGTRAYLTSNQSNQGGLISVDVSNPTFPSLRWVLDTPGTATNVVISGEWGYVADMSSLLVIYIATPNPFIVGSVPGTQVFDVAVVGNYAYVVSGANDLQVVDVSDPLSPVVVGSASIPGGPGHVVVSGNYAYVTEFLMGLTIVDISNPTSPQIMSTGLDNGEITEIVVEGTHAYLAASDKGLQVVDVSNPAAPFLVGTVDTPLAATGIAVAGNFAYVGDGGGGIQVIDISNPSSMFIQGCAYTSEFNGVAVGEEYVYVVGHFEGLKIFPTQCPSTVGIADPSGLASPSALLAQNHPNPFVHSTSISFTMPAKAGRGSLEVYDAMGRQVRVLSRGIPTGRHAITWDGRDSRGARVPSGVYFYRLTAGTLQEEKKLVVLSAP